jgi:septal ring factor EnvC (AmiA/AmiB activator)
MRDRIEAKIAALQGELQKADEELSKLRPRVQYLETIIYRIDGALTAMQSLLEMETPGVGNGQQATAQPVAS